MANKYNDPRWQRKRLEVMERDGWACVACLNESSTLNVHHKRYKGELWESLDEDLQTLCDVCHSDLGGHPKGGVWYENRLKPYPLHCDDRWTVHVVGHCPKCSRTTFIRSRGVYRCASCSSEVHRPATAIGGTVIERPATFADEVPVFCGRDIRTFYLAGKITGQSWRSSIVPQWESASHGSQDIETEWDCLDVEIPCLDGYPVYLTGPYWVDQSGGHCGPCDFYPKGPHATNGCGGPNLRNHVYRNVKTAIQKKSDFMFAWIDSFDCFGTLWELGVAAGAGVPCVVAISSGMRDSLAELWLSIEGCQVVIEAETPKLAWDCFWHQIAKGWHSDSIPDNFLALRWDSMSYTEEAIVLERLVAERRRIMGLS